MDVSILILTYNEEANLPRCLGALEWCDDIVVVDSGSTDRSVQIAQAYGARVLTRPFDNFAAQRNFGLAQGAFRHDWVLHLDADEVVTEEFVNALRALEPQNEIDAYNVPSKTVLFGRWLKHAGMWPSYQVRLGHRERLRFKQVGHGQREDLPPDRLDTFPEPYLHYNFSHGMRRWLQKHMRYAEDEAALIGATASAQQAERGSATSSRRRLKRIANRIPLFLRPAARFSYVYFYRQGFRDGRAGLIYAVMLAVYEGMIAVFAYERIMSQRTQEENVPSRQTELQ